MQTKDESGKWVEFADLNLVRPQRMSLMRKLAVCLLWLALAETVISAQTVQAPTENYSGMYSFLQDGEFVQISVEEEGRVTGFISRYGDLESDRGAFLDHFFKLGKLDGRKLTFTTETVHGIWYDFKGSFDRGQGKNPGDEAYYILRGTLTQFTSDTNKKASSRSREVAFKSFPQDMDTTQEKRD
jgi:hypothetical protein